MHIIVHFPAMESALLNLGLKLSRKLQGDSLVLLFIYLYIFMSYYGCTLVIGHVYTKTHAPLLKYQ